MNEATIGQATIMERLRNETKTAHQQLEKTTMPFIKNAVDNASYSRLLQVFYGFFKPAEQLIQPMVTTDVLPDMHERRQSEAIKQDLESIDSAPGTEVATKLPTITNMAQALGALYVLEGSTLGGRIISKILMRQLGQEDASIIRFFSGYGEQTDAKWATFKNAVNEYAAANPGAEDEIVAAANDTFSSFQGFVEGVK